jgi:hypothetical protein
MAQVTVKVEGASRDATFSWDHSLISLTDMGDGSRSGAVDATSGAHALAVDVFGAPGDPWSAAVTGTSTPLNFSGHMSSRGSDTTGDRFVVVP